MRHLFFALALTGVSVSAQERLVVLDAETGERCAEAAIWVIPLDGPWRHVVRDPQMTERERFVAQGRPLRADARGEVTLPDLPLAEVAALAGERWGQRTLAGPTRGPFAVEVHRDPVVDVYVLGADGKPAPVTATCRGILPTGAGRIGHLCLRGDPRTGMSRLRPLPLTLQARHGLLEQGRIDDGASVEVSLDVVAARPIALELDLGAPLPSRVELRAPVLGSLRVEVRDEDGARVNDGFAAAMVVGDKGRRSGASVSRLVRDGVARFEAVAIGTKVRVQVGREHRQPTFVLVDGPSEAGQEVVCEVNAPAGRADGKVVHRVTGRLLDEAGAPLARCGFTAVVQRDGRARLPAIATGVTDADGAFEVHLVDAFRAGDEVLLAIAGSGAMVATRVVDRLARGALELGGARTDLGNVRSVVAPLLFAGRVVDTDGLPVDARIEVLPGTGNVAALPGSSCLTDHDGHFAVHAAVLPTVPVKLRCQPSARSENREYELEPGARDVTIEVPAHRSVRGRLVLPAARAARHLQVVMVPVSPEAVAASPLPAGVPALVAADGSFTTWPVAPGTYDLLVLLDNAFEVARVAGLAVPATGVAEDDRLRAVDLRESLREVSVRVTAQGPIEPGTELCFAPREGTRPARRMELPEVLAAARARELRLWLPKGDFTVQVRRAGRVALAGSGEAPSLQEVGDRCEVVLPR